MPQRAYVPVGTLRRAATYPEPPESASDADIQRVLKMVGLGHLADRLDDDSAWDRTLSGGEKQRLSIARAFLKDAPVLILDEPTSALDARTEGILLDALDRLMGGRVSFIIAHRLSTIRNASRILVIDKGRIVDSGTHAELLEARGLYAALYNRQMDLASHDVPVDELMASGDVES